MGPNPLNPLSALAAMFGISPLLLVLILGGGACLSFTTLLLMNKASAAQHQPKSPPITNDGEPKNTSTKIVVRAIIGLIVFTAVACSLIIYLSQH